MADKQRVAQGLLGTNKGVDGEEGSAISDAASAWETMLDGDDDYATEEHDDQVGGEETTDDDQEDQLSEDDESDDEADDKDDGEDEEDDEDGEDEEDDDSEAPEIDPATKVKVKVDGKEEEVSFDELKAGYSRTQDYTRKTQELANERKTVEQQKGEVLQQQQQWSQALGALNQRLQVELSGRSEADWQKLKQQDEIAYYEEREKERAIQDRMKAIQSEQQRVQQEHQEYTQKQQREFAKQERERLLEKVTEWSDPTVFAKDAAQIKTYAGELGFSEEEVNGIIDHRALVALRDAAKYRALMAAKQGKAKQKAPSKVRKTLKPGTPSNKAPSSVRKKKSAQRLAKEHSIDAATDHFYHLLDD